MVYPHVEREQALRMAEVAKASRDPIRLQLIDGLLSARRVSPAGLACGLDMTDEMLELARRNEAEVGVRGLRGSIENIPLPAHSVDGSTVPDMDGATKSDIARHTGCVAGALTHQEFPDALIAPGLVDVEIHEAHRVHPAAASTIIRAADPDPSCSTRAQATCCEPGERACCCGSEGTSTGGCGCS